MAEIDWLGRAAAVAQVWKATVGTINVGDTWTITVTDRDKGGTVVFTYTATAADTTATIVATNMATQWNADQRRQLSYMTMTTSTAQVILTADVAGQPFTVAEGVTGTNTWATAGAITTASSGPNSVGQAENYLGGALPSASDTVRVPAGASAMLYDLNALSGTTIVFKTDKDSGQVGRIEAGEVFPLRLSVNATVTLRGRGALVAVDIGASAVAFEVDHDGPQTYADQPTVYVNGTAITNVTCNGGNVGICAAPGQVGTVTGAFKFSSGNIFVGSDASALTVTGTTAENGDAHVRCYEAIPTVTQLSGSEGSWRQYNVVNGTSVTINDGRFYPNVVGGTWPVVVQENDSVVDKSENAGAVTFTTWTVRGNSEAPTNQISYTTLNASSWKGGIGVGS